MVTDVVAIVTGGSRGIGGELARTLASRGYAVVVVYLDEADAALEGDVALMVRADVTDELDVERVFEETKLVFREIDVVVHAASADPRLMAEQAARDLRHGGLFVGPALSSALASELHAHRITVHEVAPHTVAAVVA